MCDSPNEILCKKAEEAIDEVFSDKSVDIEAAIVNLNCLRDHIDILIEALEYNQE